MRVLVTDGAMNKSLAVVRAVSDVSSWIGVTSRFPVSPAGVSRHADASHWIRAEEPVAYVDELDRIAAEGGYDQLLPVGGRTFEVVSEHRDRLDLPVDAVLPSRESMRTAVEKRRTYELAERVGVPTPATVSVAVGKDLATVEERVGYPAVVKTGVETEPRYVEVVASREELEAALDEYRVDHRSAPLVQEYLPGVGRGYFGLYVDGELAGGYAHRRVREYPPEGGASACAESTADDELRGHSERLMAELGWTGVAMVEFKESAEGVPKVVEINPKFWGSLDLAIASGMNFPAALLRLADGRDSFEFDFSPRRVHWPLSGDLTHAWRRPGSAAAVVRDLLSPGTRSNLRIDDPLPHLLEGAITLARRDV